MRFRAVRWRAHFAGVGGAPLRLRRVPCPPERVRGDRRRAARRGELCFGAGNTRRAMEAGGTSRCHKLAEEMEGNHAYTEVCVRAYADRDFCAFGRARAGEGACRRKRPRVVAVV